MKNLLLVSSLVLGATATFGQTINFAASKGIFDVDGTTPLSAAKGLWQVVFNGTIITPNGDNGVAFSKTGSPQLNTVFGGTVFAFPASTGIKPGDTPTITVNVWDKTTGATFAAAQAGGHYATEVIKLPALGDPASPATPPSLPWTKLVLVPET